MEIVRRKVIVITDSIASIPLKMKVQFNIKVVPINIHFNGQTYRDGVDLTVQEAYRILEKDPEHFISSPASIGEYFEVFKDEVTNADGILVITLSAKLSTLYNVANLAREQAREKFPDFQIELLDSGTATVGEGLVVTAAARAASEGKSLAEVTLAAKKVRDRVKVDGILNTIRYVYRTGRIPEIPARLGSLLNIKPVFKISGGVVHIAGVVRDREKGFDKIFNQMKQTLGDRPIHVAIAHADSPESGKQLEEKIESEFNYIESWLTDFSPVMAYATGAGVMVIAYYADD
jgi:DegV family protein with EDD domain